MLGHVQENVADDERYDRPVVSIMAAVNFLINVKLGDTLKIKR